MSKEKVKKDKHQCSVCGRLSAAKSVLRQTKDEKTGVISYHCTNSKKCAEDKKAGGLVNGQRKKKVAVKKVAEKKVVAKKAAETKKVEEAQATA